MSFYVIIPQYFLIFFSFVGKNYILRELTELYNSSFEMSRLEILALEAAFTTQPHWFV